MTVARVVEALVQDVGYGRIRLSADQRITENIGPGDVVQIQGARTTAAVVWRSHPADEGRGVAHLDNLTRKNAGVSIGDKVSITKATVRPATRVVLVPAIGEDQKVQFGDGIEALAKRGLLKRALCLNDILIVPNVALFGNSLPFRVHRMEPEGICLINEETKLEVLESDQPPTENPLHKHKWHFLAMDPATIKSTAPVTLWMCKCGAWSQQPLDPSMKTSFNFSQVDLDMEE